MKSRLKKILFIVGVLFLIILISFLGIKYYINNHKKELISKIEIALNENRKGKVIFDSIVISSIDELPNIKIQAYNIALIDSLYSQHKRKTVFLKELSATISVIDLLNEEIKIKSLSAKKGQINIFVDEDHYTNRYVFNSKAKSTNKELDLKIIDTDIDIMVADIEFISTDKIKNKRITSHINKIDFNIDLENLVIPKLNLDIFMKEMGLNLNNGTFFNNVRCVGVLHPKIDTINNTIELPDFELKIGEQDFKISAFINTKENRFKFLISLDEANFSQSLHLLSANIKSKLAVFDIVKPFKFSSIISGSFVYKSNPLIELEYSTQGNEIIYKKDSLHFKDVAFDGSFRNRIYNDSLKPEHLKNLTNHFKSLSGTYKNIPFQITHFTLTSEFSKPLHLKSDFKSDGKIKYINSIINSPDYYFSSGDYKIKGNFNGYINSVVDVINFSNINIESTNLLVKNKQNNTIYKLPHLVLEANENNAELKELLVEINADERLDINGTISNFGTLLFDDENNKPIVSTINISSNYINYDSFLTSLGSIEKQSQSKNLAQVKQSINTLVNKFNPKLNFSLQQLDFFDIPFKNIKLIAHNQKNILKITELSGNYKEGGANAVIDIDLSPRKNKTNEETLYLDLNIDINGKIEHWAENLHNKYFFFIDSYYDLTIKYANEINALKDFIDKSDLVLNVQEGSMLHTPTNLTIPFLKISLHLKNKNAYLKDFILKLPKNQTIHLSGEIENFTEIFKSTDPSQLVKSFITISSENIDFSNFIDAYNPSKKNAAKQNNIKLILKDLHQQFQPTLSLKLGRLSYKSVSLEKVNAIFYFKDFNTLKFKDVYSYYFNKKVGFEAEFDLSHATQTPFNTNFTADDIAIEKLLKTFDNFGYTHLNQPTEVTGMINTKAFFKGIIDDTSGVIDSTLKADVNYSIKELRVKNFKPLIDAGNKLFRKERFEDIRFAEINSSLSLKNNLIILAKTSVQSTAFDFFIEGNIDNTNQTDIWISIPLSNIKRRDLTKVPDKKAFGEAGKNIYLEIKSGQNSKLDHKLYLGKKKYIEAMYKPDFD